MGRGKKKQASRRIRAARRLGIGFTEMDSWATRRAADASRTAQSASKIITAKYLIIKFGESLHEGIVLFEIRLTVIL